MMNRSIGDVLEVSVLRNTCDSEKATEQRQVTIIGVHENQTCVEYTVSETNSNDDAFVITEQLIK